MELVSESGGYFIPGRDIPRKERERRGVIKALEDTEKLFEKYQSEDSICPGQEDQYLCKGRYQEKIRRDDR